MLSPAGTADTRGYLVPTELQFRQDTPKMNSSIKSLLHSLFYFFCKNCQQHCEQILLLGRRNLQSNQQVTRTVAFPLTLQGQLRSAEPFHAAGRKPQCSAIWIQQFHVKHTQDIFAWPHGTALQGCTCESIGQMDAPGNKAYDT